MRSAVRWKIATGVLAVLLVATNGLQLYGSLDSGVTLMYREQTLYRFARSLTATSALASLAVRGKPKAEVIEILKRMFPADEPFEKDGAINTPSLRMKIDSEGIVQGLEIDDLVSHWAQPDHRSE